MTTVDVNKANKRTLRNSIIIVVLMFGFGFAMSPLYEAMCRLLGLNGKTEKSSFDEISRLGVNKNRQVVVEFHADVHSKLPWRFHTDTGKVSVYPGEQKRVYYVAENLASEENTGMARFTISPPEAGRYFKKAECFCFSEQTLGKRESKKMPVLFVVDPKLPERITHITLSYEFLEYTKKPGSSKVVANTAQQ